MLFKRCVWKNNNCYLVEINWKDWTTDKHFPVEIFTNIDWFVQDKKKSKRISKTKILIWLLLFQFVWYILARFSLLHFVYWSKGCWSELTCILGLIFNINSIMWNKLSTFDLAHWTVAERMERRIALFVLIWGSLLFRDNNKCFLLYIECFFACHKISPLATSLPHHFFRNFL